MVASALSVWGIVPMQAADGAEAVALAGGHRFGLILMDLDMPVLGGLAATEQIRRFEVDRSLQRASVVAYSSSPLGDDPALLRASGFDAALKKPCNLHALQACLTRWCGIDAAALAAASAHAESPSSHVRAMQ
jgi:CheY-like chemotaxis protein